MDQRRIVGGGRHSPRRRELITSIGGAVLLRPVVGAAQQPSPRFRMAQVALVSVDPLARRRPGFAQGLWDELERLGHREGGDLDSRAVWCRGAGRDWGSSRQTHRRTVAVECSLSVTVCLPKDVSRYYLLAV